MLRIKLLTYSDLFLKIQRENIDFKIVFKKLLKSAINDDRLFKELFK